MSDHQPPPPSASGYGAQPPHGDDARVPRRSGWKIATAVVTVLGVALAGTVYVVMDRRADDLDADLRAANERIAELEEAADEAESGLGGLGDLGGLEDLLGGLVEGDLGDLGGLEDLLGGLGGGDLGGLGELLGGSGALDGIDPILFQCLTPEGGGMNLGGEGSIPEGDVASQVAAIEAIVEEERGVAAEGEIDIEFVTLDEVQRRAVDINGEAMDPDEAAADGIVLAALGAVEPGTDLLQTQLDALDAGVGGFYDPESGELVIGSETMDGTGALITSHELVHAMTDATHGLPDTEAIAADQGADAAYAALNAIEGDASLYSQRFISSHLPMQELLALQSTSDDTSEALDELPHFVGRNLEFPYVDGMTFTCDLFLEGGWDAVDATYTDVPSTTAQILFPDRYRAGEEAVDVRDPAGPQGWTQVESDTFGAADLLFLLEAPGDDEDAALSDLDERVAAWAGGEVSAWSQGESSAVGLVLADRGDTTPLCDTVTEFYAAAFPDAEQSDDAGTTLFTGDTQTAVVTCDGAEVALGIGPDIETARAAVS